MQAHAIILLRRKGGAAIFAPNSRTMKGVRGDCQVKLDHGVSKFSWGRQQTVDVFFQGRLSRT
jgi:hypothetical protein